MTTPTCPPGTVQVGITTVRYPEGDKTCIICKDCEPVEDLDCYNCCPPESLALGWRCVPVWEHQLRLKEGGVIISIARSTSKAFQWVPAPANSVNAITTSAIPFSISKSCHIPEQTVTLFGVVASEFDLFEVISTYLGEACYRPCP